MKKIENPIICELDGTPATITRNGSTCPFYAKYAFENHFNLSQEIGEKAIKIFQLGCKITGEKNEVSHFILEDAELELLQELCRPANPHYSSIVYGQLEEIFKKAEDYKTK